VFVRDAVVPLSPVAWVARPVASGKTKVSIRGHFDSHARVGALPVTAVALPVVAVRVEIGVRWYLDGHARVLALPVTSVTLPVASGTVEVSVRRDVDGYATALEYFDERLPELLAKLNDEDLLIITADHGCDPTWPGSDHTREHIPVIALGAGLAPGPLGKRDTFADIGQSIATYFKLPPMDYGTSFM